MPDENGAAAKKRQHTVRDSAGDYGPAFPSSRKVFVEGRHGVRVPMREITLAGGEPSLRVNDTSGPLGADPHMGLPKLRAGWIEERGGVIEGDTSYRPVDPERATPIPEALQNRPLRSTGGPVTQMQYARHGDITPEMEFIALREGMDAEFVREEVAVGRAIIPANINHPESEPMIIGRAFRVKINANIGNSAVGLLDRRGGREAAVGDTLGRRHSDGPLHRQEHPRNPPVDHPELSRAHRNGADLSGAREGERDP